MTTFYTGQDYVDSNPTWHDEDSGWKAKKIFELMYKNKLRVSSVAEVGCGAGGILSTLQSELPQKVSFSGYEIAPPAFAMAKKKENVDLKFYNKDIFEDGKIFDLLLIIDVIEHVPNYYEFAEKCRKAAKWKIYHIPLEVNVLSVSRASFAFPLDSGRNTVGHLHFYTKESALMALKETGHRVIDTTLTEGATALAHLHPSLKRSIANVPRRLVSSVSKDWSARLFGGYSLLALCE